MSTRCTVAHGDTFHLYKEVMDDQHVYLELEKGYFEADPDRVMVKIPLEVWEVIREHRCADTQHAEKTDEEIRAEAEEFVRERVEAVAKTEEGSRARTWANLCGSMVYGMATDPPADQVQQGVAYLTEERDRQRELKRRIEEAKRKKP